MTEVDFDIRPANAGDAAAIADLLAVSYPALLKDAYQVETLKAALPIMLHPDPDPDLLTGGTYFVFQQGDGTIIGCGGWTREQPGDQAITPGIGHIRHVVVHPDLIRNGIGRAIMTITEATAMAAGIKGFECFSTLNAEPFYAALGFDAVERGEVKIGGAVWFPSVLMRKRIG